MNNGRVSYIFLRKDKFVIRPNLLAAIAIFKDGQEPELYLVPADAWLNPTPPLSDRLYDQEGQKSKPEYGFSVTAKHAEAIGRFAFGGMAQQLFD